MDLSERVAIIIVKGVVLVLGTVAVGFMYIVEHMGGVLAVSTYFHILKYTNKKYFPVLKTLTE